MKMRKMFYFYISMDSRVKIGCFLNNIVAIAQDILVLYENGVERLHLFLVSRKGPFLKTKILKNDTNS